MILYCDCLLEFWQTLWDENGIQSLQLTILLKFIISRHPVLLGNVLYLALNQYPTNSIWISHSKKLL